MEIKPPLTRLDLQHFLDQHRIAATILPMREHTPTVPEAARVLEVEADQIIKSLVFMIKAEPLLVINNGLAKVDRSKIASYMGVGKKQVKFATAEQALAVTGYIVGSMPPFGHHRRLRTLIDPAVLKLEVVFGGGGDIDAMLRLASAELLLVLLAVIMTVF
jgi:prolyl-tRNA editing enzyme YbaK/EbsC (Cys-tRNA(Pro) deacylase)